MNSPAVNATPNQLRRDAKQEPLIFDDVHLELCPALATLILKRAATETSTASLNRGGWKSSEGFFNSRDPAVAELARTLIGIVGAKPNGWAMVNRRGSHHPRHQHRMAIVSIVYYVTTGNPLVPTIFECGDGTELEVEPSLGRLVVFTGEMWHRVPKYEGEEPRITIAGDIQR